MLDSNDFLQGPNSILTSPGGKASDEDSLPEHHPPKSGVPRLLGERLPTKHHLEVASGSGGVGVHDPIPGIDRVTTPVVETSAGIEEEHVAAFAGKGDPLGGIDVLVHAVVGDAIRLSPLLVVQVPRRSFRHRGGQKGPRTRALRRVPDEYDRVNHREVVDVAMPELARVVGGSLAEPLRRLEDPDSGRQVQGDRRNHAHIVGHRRHHLGRRREVDQTRELVEFVDVAEVVEVVLLRERRPSTVLTTTLLDQSIRFRERGIESGERTGSIDRPSVLETIPRFAAVVRIVTLEKLVVSVFVAVDHLSDLVAVTDSVPSLGEPTGVRDANPVLESTEEPVYDSSSELVHRISSFCGTIASANTTLMTWPNESSRLLPSGSAIMP